MNNPYQHFSEQFLDWERLGRGTLPVADHAISLEPPFRPFVRYRRPAQKTHDDGSRPTFLTRAVNAFRPPIVPREEEEEEFTFDFDFFEREAAVEISVSLPPDYSPVIHASEALLSQLRECSEPVALELFGSSEAVKLQFATGETDSQFLLSSLRSYFPDGVFRIEKDAAFSAFERANPSEAAILDCGLGREFFFPLATPKLDPFIGLVGALSELKDGEFGMFQVLFQPIVHGRKVFLPLPSTKQAVPSRG